MDVGVTTASMRSFLKRLRRATLRVFASPTIPRSISRGTAAEPRRAEGATSAEVGAWSSEEWELAIRLVFARALTDASFRDLALADARAAILTATGREPPEQFAVRFVEKPSEQTLVLPRVILGQTQLSEIDISRIIHHAIRRQALQPVVRT